MREGREINTVKDVVAQQQDFVVEYQDMTIFMAKYTMKEECLGEGAFGVVQMATLKSNGEKRAVKIIDKLLLDSQDRIRLKYEIDILRNLNHPNIVRLYEVYENKNKLLLVQELCDGYELFDAIKHYTTFNEKRAAEIIQQLIQAISYCHAKNVVHRDLKPENILIDFNREGHIRSIKLIDFGVAHHHDAGNSKMHQMYGTPYYIAPEVIAGNYTDKCDMWSIGVILYILLSGNPPYSADEDKKILKLITEVNWKFQGQVWNGVSADAKDFLTKLMTKNPQ